MDNFAVSSQYYHQNNFVSYHSYQAPPLQNYISQPSAHSASSINRMDTSSSRVDISSSRVESVTSKIESFTLEERMHKEPSLE